MRTFSKVDYSTFRPFGNIVVVEVERPEEKTKGGLFIPETSRDTQRFGEVVGRVVSMGEMAFMTNVNGTLKREDVQEGDLVVFHPYAGDLHEHKDKRRDEDGPDYRVMPSTTILGRVARETETKE